MEEELEGAAAAPAPASGPAPADPGEEEVVEEVAAVFGVVTATFGRYARKPGAVSGDTVIRSSLTSSSIALPVKMASLSYG